VSTTPTHAALNAQVVIGRHTHCFIACFHYRSRVCVVIDIVAFVGIALTRVRGYRHRSLRRYRAHACAWLFAFVCDALACA